MKITRALALLAGPCAAFLLGRGAAASSYVHGAICHRSGSNDIWRVDTEGFHNDSGSAEQLGICPIPVDHAVGTSQQFETVVRDAHNTRSVACLGVVLDVNGNVLGMTGIASTTAAFVGQQKLSYMITAADLSNYSYMTACELPRVSGINASGIRTLRVF